MIHKFLPYFSVYTLLVVHFFLFWCVYTQLNKRVSSLLLCLYAADKHVSTTAVSIRSWRARFAPACCVCTQLIRSYHHFCTYRQIIYTFASCLSVSACIGGRFYTLPVSVFSCTRFHVCYITFLTPAVSMSSSCERFHLLRLNPLDVHRFSLLLSL